MAISDIRENVAKVLVGKEELTDYLLTCIVAKGHVLLEDVPGTGKTVLAKTIAKSIEGQFSRIQFTPDLLPADITGLNIYNQKSGEFNLRKGPIFGNIVLADEINRATPRTQSALLEGMEERQVTIDTKTLKLEEPFMVIATENPIETAGTFPLPEASLDRFLMKLSSGTPSVDEEILIMEKYLMNNPMEDIQCVCTIQEIIEAQREYKKVYIHKDLIKYIADIVAATRNNPKIDIGVSPRGTLAMLNAVRAYGYVKGRSYVVPEDIKKLVVPVFAHRLVVNSLVARANGRTQIMEDILGTVEVPTEEWDK